MYPESEKYRLALPRIISKYCYYSILQYILTWLIYSIILATVNGGVGSISTKNKG